MDFQSLSAVTPIPLVHQPLDDIERLRRWIQTAIKLEFTTIPAYLTALYSIVDKTSDAYQTVRSVVVEEMFHVNQIANLLVSIGGTPQFTDSAVPTYPAYLPSAKRGPLPYVGLYRASPAVFQGVFMAIEMPAPFTAPAEGEQYTTIGQFYKAIDQGLESCVDKYGSASVFRQAAGVRQRNDIYLGKFGGRAVEVHDLSTAKFAIRQIVEQGEGAVDPTRTLVADEPWGTYLQYGRRLDGTFGPILGTPYELSHYFKFKRIVEGGQFPDTYPIVSNPRLADFSNPDAKQAAVAFNRYYSVMLRSLEKAFAVTTAGRDPYFEITLPLMHSHLPQVAGQLVTTPMASDGDPSVGPNAAPTFEYETAANLQDLAQTVSDLHETVVRAQGTRRTSAPPITRTVLGVPAEGRPRNPSAFDRLARNVQELHRRSEDAGFEL
jgi:hypothetical protein